MVKGSKLISFKNFDNSSLNKLGLKCGLEIHQQLNIGKLFCSCPCFIENNDLFDTQVSRKLRFSISESGTVDNAAKDEFKKGKFGKYKFNSKIACLVDLDEEPPKEVNKKALSTAIRVSQMFNLSFFDRFQFMRKLIIDGSIISGFQRTMMLGGNGELITKDGNKISIDGINLEEDSSRTLTREDDHTIFSLDRQGIPLIEITTGPQIKTPNEAYDVAFQIGNVLRSFSEVKRGLGTIRQDLNVSIRGGARVEIKGAQNLKLIPKIIENEMIRQKIHFSIIDELKERNVDSSNFSDKKIIDITSIFKNTNSKVILDNLKEKGSKVLAIKLNSFKGILGHEMQENFRFATEISNRNKAHFPSIKGLFHFDEMPNYGIVESELNNISKNLNLGENDSYILLAGNEEFIRNSLNYILEIISNLISDVPTEVRKVDPKGVVTNFLRPMPGSGRMYPETDVPLINIEDKEFDLERKNIPELYSNKMDRLSKKFSLENSKLEEMLNFYNEEKIENLLKISSKKSSFVYNVLFEIPKDIKKREKLDTFNFKYSLLEDVFKFAKDDSLNLKLIRDLFISLYKEKKDEVSDLKNYLKKHSLVIEKVDEKDVEDKIKLLISENNGAPFGALMGKSMALFKGKVDGQIISKILKKLL